MKNFLSILGVISLICFSFIFTESTLNVAVEMSDLTTTIKNEKDKYKVEKQEAVINNLTIIPGVNGKEVNIKKSYYNMKRIGSFVPSLLIYDEIKVKESIKENKDKYIISGNKNKNMVSLIFLVTYDYDLSKIIKILDSNNIQGNFFIDYSYTVNADILKQLVKNNHIIGNLNNSNLTKNDFYIKSILNQKENYCYNELSDTRYLKECFKENDYTIKPNIIVKNNPYKTVKENLESGSLISFKVNKQLEIELLNIINFIKSKGLEIKNLDVHLNETL